MLYIELLYLDPGSGSYLVQVLAAAALGIVFFFRQIKLQILTFFSFIKRGFRKEKTDKTSTDQ